MYKKYRNDEIDIDPSYNTTHFTNLASTHYCTIKFTEGDVVDTLCQQPIKQPTEHEG